MNNSNILAPNASNTREGIQEKARAEVELLEELIPLRKGGAMMGVPYETMRRYVKLRIIPYYKIGGRIKVHKYEIRDWYNARKILPLDSTAKNHCEVNRHDNLRSQEKGSQPEAPVGPFR